MPAPRPVKVKAWAQSLQAEPKMADTPALEKVAAREESRGRRILPRGEAGRCDCGARTRDPGPAGPADLGPVEVQHHRTRRRHVVQLNPNLFIAPVQTTNNPFLQLYQPPYKPKDEKIVVSAAIPGPNPTCIINGMMFAEGTSSKGRSPCTGWTPTKSTPKGHVPPQMPGVRPGANAAFTVNGRLRHNVHYPCGDKHRDRVEASNLHELRAVVRKARRRPRATVEGKEPERNQ